MIGPAAFFGEHKLSLQIFEAVHLELFSIEDVNDEVSGRIQAAWAAAG
jgi:hypothetical protein